MDEWMDEAFRRAWRNYDNKSLLDMGLITERLPIRRIVCVRNLDRDRIGIGLVTGKAA